MVREAKKQKYELSTIEEYISKAPNKDGKGNPLEARAKLNLALNAMLEGKKIVGTCTRKGLSYFILEAE